MPVYLREFRKPRCKDCLTFDARTATSMRSGPTCLASWSARSCSSQRRLSLLPTLSRQRFMEGFPADLNQFPKQVFRFYAYFAGCWHSNDAHPAALKIRLPCCCLSHSEARQNTVRRLSETGLIVVIAVNRTGIRWSGPGSVNSGSFSLPLFGTRHDAKPEISKATTYRVPAATPARAEDLVLAQAVSTRTGAPPCRAGTAGSTPPKRMSCSRYW